MNIGQYFILSLMLTSQLGECRSTSISAELEIIADISSQLIERREVRVQLYQDTRTLVWNRTDKSFVDAYFDYFIEVNDDAALSSNISYLVGLRDINLSCNSRVKNSYYSGVDISRKAGFGKIDVRWGNGALSTFSNVGPQNDLSSPQGALQPVYSNYYQKMVPGGNGTLEVQFPLLTSEVADGGANCRGGAVVMFYGDI